MTVRFYTIISNLLYLNTSSLYIAIKTKLKVWFVCYVHTCLEFGDFPNNFEDRDGRNQW